MNGTTLSGFVVVNLAAILSFGTQSSRVNFAECMTGPDGQVSQRACQPHDIDGDGDVDLLDWAELTIDHTD